MISINNLCESEYKALQYYLSSCKLDTTDEGIVSSCETRLVSTLAFYPNITLMDAAFLSLMLGMEGCRCLQEGIPGWYKLTEKNGKYLFSFRRDKEKTCKCCLLKEVSFNGWFTNSGERGNEADNVRCAEAG